MVRTSKRLCLAVFLLFGSACSIYGSEPGREERAVAQASERGFHRVGQPAVVDDRYVHMLVWFGDEANPCSGKLIVDMSRPKDEAGKSTTVIVPETFLRPDGIAYRAIPKQVQDPIISEMNDDDDLRTCFQEK